MFPDRVVVLDVSVERLAGFHQVGHVADLEVFTDLESEVESLFEQVFESEGGCFHFQGQGSWIGKT